MVFRSSRQTCTKFQGATKYQSSRSACLALVLVVAVDWLVRGQNEAGTSQLTMVKQVEAILSPKSRVCFNSLSTSFQSECVYCDSRLYERTLLACTGQPSLPNNVTQAQAFCIATACLQVPVFSNTKFNPLKVNSNSLFDSLYKRANWFASSPLFKQAPRPTLFGPTSAASAATAGTRPLSSSPSFSLLYSSARALTSDGSESVRSLQPASSTTRTNRQVELDRKLESLLMRRRGEDAKYLQLVVEPAPTNEQNESLSQLPAPSEQSDGSTGAVTAEPEAAAATTTSAPAPTTTTAASPSSGDPQLPRPTTTTQTPSMAAEETRAYPDFNQLHAQIYTNIWPPNAAIGPPMPPLTNWWRRTPSSLSSFAFPTPNYYYSIKQLQQQQLQASLVPVAGRVANLMQTVSNSLAMKRASANKLWQRLGTRIFEPRLKSPTGFKPTHSQFAPNWPNSAAANLARLSPQLLR